MRFEPGQQVSYDDYLWDVAETDDDAPQDQSEYVYLWDGYERYVWAPVDDVYEY